MMSQQHIPTQLNKESRDFSETTFILKVPIFFCIYMCNYHAIELNILFCKEFTGTLQHQKMYIYIKNVLKSFRK